MTDEIDIVRYDPHWVDVYGQERKRLLALPRCPLDNIEHIGSTAVAGLAAKPVVDILASTDDPDAFAAWTGPLEKLGYRARDAGFAHRKFFVKPAPDGRVLCHLHVVSAEAWPQSTERLFRDWLRAHPDCARSYADLKAELAVRLAGDMPAYTKAKSGFIRAVVNDARAAQGLAPKTDWRE